MPVIRQTQSQAIHHNGFHIPSGFLCVIYERGTSTSYWDTTKKKKKAVWETRCAVVLQEYYLSICGKLFIEQLSF